MPATCRLVLTYFIALSPAKHFFNRLLEKRPHAQAWRRSTVLVTIYSAKRGAIQSRSSPPGLSASGRLRCAPRPSGGPRRPCPLSYQAWSRPPRGAGLKHTKGADPARGGALRDLGCAEPRAGPSRRNGNSVPRPPSRARRNRARCCARCSRHRGRESCPPRPRRGLWPP